jgi:hypothetical protein
MVVDLRIGNGGGFEDWGRNLFCVKGWLMMNQGSES